MCAGGYLSQYYLLQRKAYFKNEHVFGKVKMDFRYEILA